MVYEKVVQTIAEKLDIEAAGLSRDTVLNDLGMDSLDVTEVVMTLENDLGIEIELSDELRTVADLVLIIEGKRA